MGKWDKGVEFEYAYNKILRNLYNNTSITKCYDIILLIQLRNGSRIGESILAFLEFLKTKKIEIEIPVEKKKNRETRLMIIPSEILNTDYSMCYELLDIQYNRLKDRIKHYCRNKYKFNTHSLRYAFITYLLRLGVNPALISKITKHSKLDFILTYTQEKQAVEILKKLV